MSRHNNCDSSSSSSSLGSDDSEEVKVDKKQNMSLKGIAMAKSLAEFLFLSYFFPQIKDAKRQTYFKNLFYNDMKFNLGTGIVDQTTSKLSNRKFLVSSFIKALKSYILLGQTLENL